MKNARSTAEGLDASSRRFGIVASRFNEALCDRLLQGALAVLRAHGAADSEIEVVRVPGAWEIPLALDEFAATGEFDALVALGVVIRGETPHFDFICSEASRGIGEVTLRRRLPIGFGLLTCDTVAHAEARAGGEAGNKGSEAAQAALEMAMRVDAIRRRSRR